MMRKYLICLMYTLKINKNRQLYNVIYIYQKTECHRNFATKLPQTFPAHEMSNNFLTSPNEHTVYHTSTI
jgi:hypothetical protein